MHLILYSKPGCHLCEGLQEKLQQVQLPENLALDLEIRDITTRDDWFGLYQYEIPVLLISHNEVETSIPRPSPRATVAQLEQMLQKYCQLDRAE